MRTPGPWKTTGPHVRSGGALVATCGHLWADAPTRTETTQANADHIVACVNGFEPGGVVEALRAELDDIKDTAWTVVAVIEAARWLLDDLGDAGETHNQSTGDEYDSCASLKEALETFDSLNTPYDSQKGKV